MQNVLLVAKRKVFAQSLIRSLESHRRFSFFAEYNYTQAVLAAEAIQADIVILEIAESGADHAAYCLRLGAEIKQSLPACKLMLICPEYDSRAQELVIVAKRLKQIEAFVFYDASLEYLTAALEGMAET